MSLLPFTDALISTSAADLECAQLADRHYSRRSHGSPFFMPSGRKLVLRNTDGSIVFGWLWSPVELRADHQEGYNCTIFRNESSRTSSDVIREAERAVVAQWGPRRAFTYVDPRKVRPTMVRGYPVFGFCFYRAGWHFAGVSKKHGIHLLDKQLGADRP